MQQFLLKCLSLAILIFAFQAHADPSNEQNMPPQAKKLTEILPKVDFRKVQELITESARGQLLIVVQYKLLKRLENDRSLAVELKNLLLKSGKKPIHNGLLFANLDKMIGVDGKEGFYDKAITLIKEDPSIIFDINRIDFIKKNHSSACVIGVYALLTIRNLKTLQSERAKDIRETFHLYYADPIVEDLPEAKKIAQKISLSQTLPNKKIVLFRM